jgi:hypothetical protein
LRAKNYVKRVSWNLRRRVVAFDSKLSPSGDSDSY